MGKGLKPSDSELLILFGVADVSEPVFSVELNAR
jgi:hypothetical protein